ncbi:hypothetical protein GN244_ATG17925 [Phytophthora infestans]|uniref:Uncharacterized protein n=1 Tax=Phytophthora infestans TaxID=4787 RepID=A0A833VVC2_PHYIN|nr:hypothetical protein GN244_ATG17925 [Phytophthora infestans]KAF4141613.1 hypothetical protein GN958_ATG09191 [Phytophthora infestans]
MGAASPAKVEKRVGVTSAVAGSKDRAVWMTWTPAMSAATIQHSYSTNPQISALLPLIAIFYGYGGARERGVDCKANSSWAQRRLSRWKSA